MCFDWARGVLALVVVFTCGCGLKTGESVPPPLSPSFKSETYACVGLIPENLDAYFKGHLAEPQIRSFIGCLQKAFLAFSQLTRGRTEGVYMAEELRNFIQRNFLRNKYVISDRLMTEFMMMKQVLVGGSFEHVTRAELYALVAVLDDVRDEAIRLRPHLALINPDLAAQLIADTKDLDLADRLRRANEALATTIRTFASRLERTRMDYSLEHLQVFLDEFRGFVHWDAHFSDAAPTNAWIKLLRNFKLAVVAPYDQNLIHPEDWAPLFTGMWRWYSAFVHYQVGVKNQLILEDVGLQNLLLFAGEIFDLTREAIQKQPDLTLGFDTVVNLADSARELGWLPKDLRATSLRRLIQALTTRVFGDPRVPVALRSSRGLTMDAIASLSADFYRWARTQADLNAVWSKGGARAVRTPNLQTHNYINPDIRRQLAGPRSSEYTDFMKVDELIEPLFPESVDGGPVRVLLAPKVRREAIGMGQSFTNLSYMNLARTLVTLVFRGYGDTGQTSSWSDGISAYALEDFYEDFRDFGVDLKLVDWRNCAAGLRSFAEGNLFTYTSDGIPDGVTAKGKLDVREAIQLLSYLYSGGTLANEYYNVFSARCEHGPDDINHLPKISRACVRRELGRTLLDYENLPGLRDYLRGQDAVGVGAYVETLLDAVFTTKNLIEDSEKKWVEMNELSTLAVVMHYMESVMVRFDRNLDGVLTMDELDAAIPVFGGFIRSFAQDRYPRAKLLTQNNVFARGAFLFILQNGRLPDQNSWWSAAKDGGSILGLGSLRHLYLSESPEPIDMRAAFAIDRGALARAFRAIINKLLDDGVDVNKETRECLPKAKVADE